MISDGARRRGQAEVMISKLNAMKAEYIKWGGNKL